MLVSLADLHRRAILSQSQSFPVTPEELSCLLDSIFPDCDRSKPLPPPLSEMTFYGKVLTASTSSPVSFIG